MSLKKKFSSHFYFEIGPHTVTTGHEYLHGVVKGEIFFQSNANDRVTPEN